jgi:CheY-like chemotaxis protein
VEDDPSTREGTRALLEAHGATVQACESAAAAREAYALQIPDIIVSDIGLPEEDGYALLSQLRTIERDQGLRRVPSLALTAFAREADQRRAKDVGYDAHLAKPVDPDRLLEQIALLTGHEVTSSDVS